MDAKTPKNRHAVLNVRNNASLRAIMTSPPMSAEKHASIQRRRTSSRRRFEDMRQARELEQLA